MLRIRRNGTWTRAESNNVAAEPKSFVILQVLVCNLWWPLIPCSSRSHTAPLKHKKSWLSHRRTISSSRGAKAHLRAAQVQLTVLLAYHIPLFSTLFQQLCCVSALSLLSSFETRRPQDQGISFDTKSSIHSATAYTDKRHITSDSSRAQSASPSLSSRPTSSKHQH